MVGSSSKGPAAEPFIVFGVVAALCCLPFISRLVDFRVHSEMTDLLAGDQRSLSSYEDADGQLANTLGEESVAVMVSLNADDVFSPKTVSDIQAISAALMKNTNFFHTFSLAAPQVKPQFIINWSRVQTVLNRRIRANELDRLGQMDWPLLQARSEDLLGVMMQHGPPLIADLKRYQAPDIGLFERTKLLIEIPRRAAILGGEALKLGRAMRDEWELLKRDFRRPLEPVIPVIEAYFSVERNATRKAMAQEQALMDLKRKVRVELGEIQREMQQSGVGEIVQFELGPLIPKSSEKLTRERREHIKQWTINYPFFRNLIVDTEGQHAMIYAFANINRSTHQAKAAFCQEVNNRLQPFRDKGLDIKLLSFPHGEVETMDYLERDLSRFLPAVVAVLLVVLLVTFRFSIRLVVFVLLMQGVGIAMALGLASILGSRISPFTVPLFPLLSGIHLTLLIHIGTALQSAQRSGFIGLEAISAMLGQVFKPSAFAALTTAVGMLSLSLSEVRPTHEFGLLGAAGIGLLFVLTFGPGMVLLKVLAGPKLPRASPASGGWTESLPGWVAQRRSLLLVVMAGVIVLVVVGAKKIRTDIRIVEFLSPKSDTRQALEELDHTYGGINFANLEIDTGITNGVRSTGFFKFITDLQQFAEQQEGVSMVYSVGSLLRAADQVLQEEFMHLPSMVTPRDRATMMLDQFERPEIRYQLPLLDSLYSRDMKKAWLVLRTRDLPSGQYIDLLNALEAKAEKIKPDGFTISMQGAIQEIQKADRQIVDSQRRSALFTAGIIAIMLGILWRSIGLALLAFVANIIPVGLIVALQGLADVPLNSITIMVGAIAFGIAVDDTIHFITHWREERRKGIASRQAVINTLHVKGRPIVSTTVILICIMAVFSLSSFPPVVAFGWLSAIGFAGALCSALLFLPMFLDNKVENK